MKKKEFIGLALDKNKIYAAHLVKVKGRLELVGVETINLPNVVETRTRPKLGTSQSVEPKDVSDEDLFFGIDDDDSADFENIDMDDESGEELSDESGPTKVSSDAEEDTTNEQALFNYFSLFGNKTLNVGINICQGKTMFQPLEAADLGKMKKKERSEFISNLLTPIYGEEITPDQYTWEVDNQGNGWLISHDYDTSLLELIQEAQSTYKGKVLVREMMSDEVIWTGLVRSHYSFEEEQITGLISIGEWSSRLIFMKGDRLFYVLPMINEGSKSKSILQTLFSKILFEIDKGSLPGLDKIIVMHSTKPGAEVIDFFRDQIKELEVEMFWPDSKKLLLTEELQDNPELMRHHVTAMGAAQVAAGIDAKRWPDLSLLPDYVRERQQSFRLQWHGVFLLLLIALSPLLINKWYQDYTHQTNELNQSIRFKDTRIADTQPIAAEVERILEEEVAVREINERISDLAKNNLLWSEILSQINEGMQQISGTWLTSLNVAGEELQIEGYTIYRNRIPLAARVFDDARIVSVNEGHIREADVLQFYLRVPNYKEEEERFSPEIPEPGEEIILEID